MGGIQMRKPIYKRWWFWAIVIIVAIAAFSTGGDDNDNVGQAPDTTQNAKEPAPAPAPAEEPDIWTKAGMYKVGTDIEAGEYMLLSNGGTSAYFQVSKDSSGSLESIITNDNFEGSRYITVSDGQYFELRNGKLAPIEEAPVQKPEDGVYKPGMYKVGRDIEPGEYKVRPQAGALAYYEVSKDSSGSLTSIVTNDNIENEKYITISEGQYIKLNSCELSK
jgi:hypothetical protein